METRANYIIIGLFVLLIILSSLGFVFWLYRSTDSGDTAMLRIRFSDPVTGLSSGSQVLFNGIRIGEVRSLGFAGDGSTNVVATAIVNARAPLKADTQAQLGLQGITGVAYVSLTGGSADEPSLLANEGEVPQLSAKPSDFADLLEGARGILAKVDGAADTFNTLIADNRESINGTVRNVEEFSGALAAASPQLSQLMEDVGAAGRALASAAPDVTALVQDLRQRVAEVDPQQVRQIMDNAVAFSTQLAPLGQSVDQIVTDVRSAAQDLGAFTEGLNQSLSDVDSLLTAFSPDSIRTIVSGVEQTVAAVSSEADALRSFIADGSAAAASARSIGDTIAGQRDSIVAAIENARSVTADASAFAQQLPDLIDVIRPGLQNISAALSAIDPPAIGELVESARSFVSGLSAQSDTIAALLQDGRSAVGDIQSVAANIAGRNEAISAIVDNTQALTASANTFAGQLPEIANSLRPAIDNLTSVMAVVDPARIDSIISSVQQVASGISQRSDAITAMIDNASGAASNINAVSETLSAQRERLTATLTNTEALSAAANAFAANLTATLESIRPGLVNAAAVASAVDPAAVSAIVGNVRGVTDTVAGHRDQIDSIITNADATVASARTVSESVASRSAEIEIFITEARAVAQSFNTVAAQLLPAIDAFTQTMSAFDRERIQSILAGVDQTVASVSSRSQEIGTAIDNASAAAEDLRSFSHTLSEQEPEIRLFINRATSIAERLNGTAERLDAVMTDVRRLVNGPATSFFVEASAAATSINTVTAAFAERSTSIARGVDRFATTGLESIRQLVDQTRATVVSIQRTVNNFDSNPTRLLTGGSAGPVYAPQRR